MYVLFEFWILFTPTLEVPCLQLCVWEFVEIPPHTKPIGCKLVFKTKMDSKRNDERYEDRLVEKGFT
jgi:hypothetical protein